MLGAFVPFACLFLRQTLITKSPRLPTFEAWRFISWDITCSPQSIFEYRYHSYRKTSRDYSVHKLTPSTVIWNDMTTSCHDSAFGVRILSVCLGKFLVQHSVQAMRSAPVQRENYFDLVLIKTSVDILFFTESHYCVMAQCFDNVCFCCTNPSERRKCNRWKGDFEGMKRHLHLQN